MEVFIPVYIKHYTFGTSYEVIIFIQALKIYDSMPLSGSISTMKNLKSFIESGMLESYVMGNSTSAEIDLVQQMADTFKEVRAEIDLISEALEFYTLANAVAPGLVVKPFLLATIDFTERLKKGEQPTFPPHLHEGSKISDYSEWLKRADMVLPETFDGLYAKIIGFTETATTAVVWIKDRAPEEIHNNEHEKFMIVEGTCNIVVGKSVYCLVPGDCFTIPLHENHQVIVTSSIPCKVILQRLAA